jgi:DNA-binding response OmpR family regulator
MATVFVGENVADLRDVLSRLLHRAGHQVRMATNADDTLSQALAAPPDLLVINPALPSTGNQDGLDGLQVCRLLRANPGTTQLPIMMLSVRQYPAEIAAAREAGADDYLGKPFDNTQLLTRLEALLIHRTPGRPEAGAGRPDTGRDTTAR